MRTRTTFASLLAFLATLALMSFVAYAETETGQITGTVMDQSGAAIPNVTVTAKGTGTGVTRTAVTGDTGTYTIANLLPGDYLVSAKAQGFAAIEQRVTVSVGSRVGL